ncbi:seryl-tRNA synthetase [Pyricularia oryzae Y34]|uniref:serine--tRNA ligase n=1 Tax=Pyricularia oryzae (strain Y34) TaxID=1143189 RepID=A0AA97P835_PYRO3|nr:seryl-tRNA synthetase [Pyricularia oryzae Y34]
MVLDVTDFITERGGNPEKIRESQRRRHAPVEVVDEIIAMWDDHRRTQYAATQMNAQINDVQKKIGAKKKAKEDASEFLQEKIALEKAKKELIDSAAEKQKILDKKLTTIGNIVHDSVPVSDNEDNNEIIRTYCPEGLTVEKRECLSHHEVLTRLDGYDPDRGIKAVGHRGYFLRQWGVFLNQAIINFGLEFLSSKSFVPLQPPFFLLKDQMSKTAQLEQFDEELYKVVDGEADKYLIATSEQPISVYHANEWLLPQDLPLRYAGYSTCFRKEAGGHGRDVWGTFRVHQFEKVEQFCITEPEKSWEMFDEMIANSEEFYKALGLPYLTWKGEYKELVSCSNCTKKEYVHCLNSTLTATSRTMCALLENYQTEDGFKVPEPLRKYLPGAPEFIPFTKELPKDIAAQAKALKEAKAASKSQKGAAGATGAAKQKVADAAAAATGAVSQVAEKLGETKV